jgi:hypothetical protein
LLKSWRFGKRRKKNNRLFQGRGEGGIKRKGEERRGEGMEDDMDGGDQET